MDETLDVDLATELLRAELPYSVEEDDGKEERIQLGNGLALGAFSQRFDGSAGAPALCALIVANTKPSLELALTVYERAPALLQQTHQSKVFWGENALHILCVNSREAELCTCIELAAKHLKPKQLKNIFEGQATGLFFTELPMVCALPSH